MPRVTLSVQQIARTGLEPSYASAEVDGNAFSNSGSEFIHVKNGDASPHTVTVLTQRQVDGQSVTNRVVSVPASEERMIGPFPTGDFNRSDGAVWFDYDAVTSMTVGIIRV